MTMVRKQVYITSDQDALLKRLAAESGLAEAEIIRAALDALAPVTYEQREASASRIRETAVMERYEVEAQVERAGQTLDQRSADEAWQAELAFIKSLGAANAGGTEAQAWKFNREELYEDRLAKILRRH